MNRKCRKHQMQKGKAKTDLLSKVSLINKKFIPNLELKLCDQARFTSFKSERFKVLRSIAPGNRNC